MADQHKTANNCGNKILGCIQGISLRVLPIKRYQVLLSQIKKSAGKNQNKV